MFSLFRYYFWNYRCHPTPPTWMRLNLDLHPVFSRHICPLVTSDVISTRETVARRYHGDVITWNHFPRYWPFVRGNSPVTGEFPAQRPVARGFVFFDLRMHKRLGNQWWNRWFETPWYPLWRQYNDDKSQCGDVKMGAIASQITSLTIVYSTVYSDADQRKHPSSASLASVRGIHRWPVNSPHKWPVTRKMFPSDDVIMQSATSVSYGCECRQQRALSALSSQRPWKLQIW